MNDLPKIADEGSLQAWLETRSPEDSILIAHRAAMRVLPLWCIATRDEWARLIDLRPLPVLWTNLISAVLVKFPEIEIQPAAVRASSLTRTMFDAINATYSDGQRATRADTPDTRYESRAVLTTIVAARDSLAATRAALLDARSAAAAAARAAGLGVLWEEIEADVHDLIAGADILAAALWRSDNLLTGVWQEAQPVLKATPGGEFWIDWYQRALDGTPQNWPLLEAVALIPDEVWQQGGDALDQAILSKIEEHALSATAYGEDIVFDEGAGRLRAIARNDVPSDYMADIDDKLAEALLIFPETPSGNDLYAVIKPERDQVERARQKYLGRPRMLLSELQSVSRRVEAKISSGDCPGDDALIVDFQARIDEVQDDLLVHSPEIRDAMEARARVRLPQMSSDQKQQIEGFADALAEISEGYLAEELPEDARTSSDSSISEPDRIEAFVRTTGRFIRIKRLIRGGGTAGKNIAGALKELDGVSGGLLTYYAIVDLMFKFLL